MPWQISDVDRFKQGLSQSQKRQWVRIANSVLAKCLEDGGSQDECEASAIRQANGAVKTQEVERTMKLMAAVKTNMPTRREEYEGRDHIVVPVVALVEGVHNKLLYLADEIGAVTEAWNGMPITVQHPTDEKGISVPASSPEIIAAQKVGRFFNAVFEDTKLKGELWLDAEKTKKLAPEVLNIINADGQLEVSTGLFTTDDESPGEWNGEKYDAIARSHLPNHLALLPGGEGACNWDDGCGVRVNEEENKGLGNFVLKKTDLKKLKDGGDNYMPEIEDQLAQLGDAEVRKDKKKVFNLFSTLGKLLKYKTEELKSEKLKIEEASYDDIRVALQGFVDDMDRPTAPQEGQYHYVKEVFDDYFIYEKRSQGQPDVLFKQSYVTDDEGKTELSGQPEEVIEETTYKLKTQKKDEEVENIMAERTKQVDELIGNEANPFCEDSREYLMKISDEVFEQFVTMSIPKDEAIAKALADKEEEDKKAAELKAKEEADAEAAKLKAEQEADAGDEDKPITMEQYLEKAPEGIKETLTRAVDRDKEVKTNLINVLVENKRNKFSQEDLESRSIVELENLSALADVPVKDYSVKGGALKVEAPKRNERQDDGSGIPDMGVMTWDKK